MVLFTCVTVTFTYAMAITIVNVSLPQMQGALGASHEEISWVLTLNIVATAITLPLCGWLVDRFGERAVMLVATAGFSFASLMCGLSDSLEALVFFRVLQGVFGAPLVPVPQALLLSTYPPARHGVVLAIYSVGAIVGPVSGPIIGGFMTDQYSWRWAFYTLVPASLIALAFTFRFIKRVTNPGPVRLPASGFLALAVGVASFQLMLDRGQREDWFEVIGDCDVHGPRGSRILATCAQLAYLSATVPEDDAAQRPQLPGGSRADLRLRDDQLHPGRPAAHFAPVGARYVWFRHRLVD